MTDALDELLADPDRDRIPGARAVVALGDEEDEELLASVAARAVATIALRRRGAAHGTWVEVGERAPAPRADARGRARWRAARPLVVPGVADHLRGAGARGLALHEGFARTGSGFTNWARAVLADSPFAAVPGAGTSSIDDRDLARVDLRPRDPVSDGRGLPLDGLWLKLGRLSNDDADASLRVRVSSGAEVEGDADSDPVRARVVRELAHHALPGARALVEETDLFVLAGELCGTRVLPTQQIAYWNAPEGGALFHHDAFDEPETDRQLGVAYVQLAGRTAWLALSIGDLAGRATELVQAMAEGELAWVRQHLFPGAGSFGEVVALVGDRAALLRELALPGCGQLGALLGHGPECTAFLADSGHGCVLGPGDAILLPNGGLERTAMHSVFCASDSTTYALSCALRPAAAHAELP